MIPGPSVAGTESPRLQRSGIDAPVLWCPHRSQSCRKWGRAWGRQSGRLGTGPGSRVWTDSSEPWFLFLEARVIEVPARQGHVSAVVVTIQGPQL